MEPLRIAAKAATSSFDYSPTRNVRERLLGEELLGSEGTFIPHQNTTLTRIGHMYGSANTV